jgi:hypothetical protein
MTDDRHRPVWFSRLMAPGRIVIALAIGILAGAQALAAKVPLREEGHIVGSLVAARVADTIRKTCPTITARTFVVLAELDALKAYARTKGYSVAEVRAFLKDPGEKARLKQMAADALQRAGAKPGDVESYCAVGRAEIAKGTLTGSLIRSRE